MSAKDRLADLRRPPSQRSALLARQTVFFLSVAVAYFVAARLSLSLLTEPDGVAVFWPAAGIATGLLIARGPSVRIPVVAGVLAATVAANLLGDRNVWSSIIFGVCNACEALLAAEVVHRLFGAPLSLKTLPRVLGLVGVALAAPAVSGLGGAVGYVLFHTEAPFVTIWRHWFASDAIGIIIVAPLIIEANVLLRAPPPRSEVVEAGAALSLLVALSWVVAHLPSEAWAVEIAIAAIFPLLLWIAARCRPAFSAAAVVIFSLTIVWTTTFGTGVYGNPDLPVSGRILSAQFSILVQALCALVLAALFAERREHILKLLRIQDQLQQAVHTARQADHAKSAFLAAASHDLRQPLQTLNFIQTAMAPHVKTEDARVLLSKLGRSIDVMNGMLTALLDINRLEAGVLKPTISEFPVGDLLESAASDFAKSILDKGLEWRVVASSLWVRSDRRMLEEMIRNLLSNAVRYTETGKIVVGCRRTAGHASIQVWDSGVGIMGEHLPRIFEEHYQVSESAPLGGFGLGLAIVKRTAGILGHRVDVQSVPGRGSGFSVEVPIVMSPQIAEVKNDRAAPKFKASAEDTILIIEDEETVRSAFVSLLRSWEFSVTAVPTPDRALALIASENLRPAVLICDYNLPGRINGVEAIKKIRALLDRKIPGIVVTGDTRPEALRNITAEGIGLCVKPVRAEIFLGEVLRLLADNKDADRRITASVQTEKAF